jgi:hypothetical protein
VGRAARSESLARCMWLQRNAHEHDARPLAAAAGASVGPRPDALLSVRRPGSRDAGKRRAVLGLGLELYGWTRAQIGVMLAPGGRSVTVRGYEGTGGVARCECALVC